MQKILDTYNCVTGAIIAILTAVFGTYWYIFAAYAILNTVDWLTGWYKARQLKKESSSIGLKGIIKKVGYWVIILVSFLTAKIFISLGTDVLNVDLTFLTMIGWFTLATLLVNEARSILENLIECGYNVPAFLIKGLAVADKLINDKTDEIDDINDTDKE